MRYIFAILTSVVGSGLLQPLAHAQSGFSSPPRDGNQLVRAAAAALSEQPCLGAKIRQRAVLMGQQLTGLGYYSQLKVNRQLMLRYEFKLQLADLSSSLLQVNDGHNLWIRRDKGALQAQSYVNLRKVRGAMYQTTNGGEKPAESLALDLALGGLGQSLANLAANFRFDSPSESELKGVPTWELDGTWSDEQLARLLPDAHRRGGAGASPEWDKLPEHLPDHVHLTLGRDENFFLFPYRIEFQKARKSSAVVGVASGQTYMVEPLVTMELFEVCRPPNLSAADFSYQPGNSEVEDLTEAYLQKLGGGGKAGAGN